MRLYIPAAFILFALPALAHISGLAPFTGTYHATSTSTFPLVFKTIASPTVNEDFSAALGIAPAGTLSDGSTGLGTFFQNLDLEALGHSGTNTGNFTINVNLSAARFFQGAGNYTLTAAVTSAFGAQWSTQLEFFRINFPVTV